MAVTLLVNEVRESAFAVIAVQLESIPDRSTALIAADKELTSEEIDVILSLSWSTRVVNVCNAVAFAWIPVISRLSNEASSWVTFDASVDSLSLSWSTLVVKDSNAVALAEIPDKSKPDKSACSWVTLDASVDSLSLSTSILVSKASMASAVAATASPDISNPLKSAVKLLVGLPLTLL